MTDPKAAYKDFNINQDFEYKIIAIDNDLVLVDYYISNFKINNPVIDLSDNYIKESNTIILTCVYYKFDKNHVFIKKVKNAGYAYTVVIMKMIKTNKLNLLTVDKNDKLYKLLYK